MRRRWFFFLVTVAVLAALAVNAQAQSTLDRLRHAGSLSCGVITEIPEYNKEDLHGGLDRLGLEICTAVAVAALGTPAQVSPKPFPIEREALTGLHDGGIDLLVGATPSATGIWAYGLQFGPAVFLDGQGFLVHRETGIGTLADLAHRRVCYIDGTETQETLDAAMRSRGIAYDPYPFQEEGEMDAALVVGHCDAVTADVSRLAEKRAGFHARAAEFELLAEKLTLDPAAVATRQGDAQWSAIVSWTVYALLQAEASGVTRDNVASMRNSADPTVQRLLGVDFAAARALGLDHDWAARSIAAVGNYGEIYERSVGQRSAWRLPRGANALWTAGGAMYPFPVR